MDCKLAAGLSAVLSAELRCQMMDLEAQEHGAGRMLDGRQIYWVISKFYKVTDVDDATRDFE
eukprot:7423552-Pyramimonas_sp.AAC.1